MGTISIGRRFRRRHATGAGFPVKKLGEVIALAKQDIAEAAGVPIDRVKISIDA